MRLSAILTAATLTLALASACGQSAEEKKAEQDRTAAVAAKKKAEAREEKIGETGALCREMVDEFSQGLDDLNSRMAIGLKKDDYDTRVGDVKVAYDATDWDASPNTYCIQKVGIPLEKALNDYIAASETWGDCISNYNTCDMDSEATPKMQKKWSHASGQIEKSHAALEDFQLDD